MSNLLHGPISTNQILPSRKVRKSRHFWHFKPTKQNIWGFLWWINVYKTSSQINDTFLFHRVIKILTGGRILQISIARCQIEAEIHSFPTMYGKGGVDVVKIGEIKVSVQKLCLKQGFFEDTNLDHLTSGWPGTHCFRGDANFDMFPKKYG